MFAETCANLHWIHVSSIVLMYEGKKRISPGRQSARTAVGGIGSAYSGWGRIKRSSPAYN